MVVLRRYLKGVVPRLRAGRPLRPAARHRRGGPLNRRERELTTSLRSATSALSRGAPPATSPAPVLPAADLRPWVRNQARAFSSPSVASRRANSSATRD